MKDPKKKASFGIILAVMLGMIVSGVSSPPKAWAYINETCYDGLNNDGDSDPFLGPTIDIDDQECVYMPFNAAGWQSGEFNPVGPFQAPQFSYIEAYVIEWNKSDIPASHYQANKELHQYFGLDVCQNSNVQDSLIIFRDQFAIPDERTGIPYHQAECGVSY